MSRKSITAVLATAALFSVLSGAVFAATSMKKEEINPQPQTSGEIALTAKLLPFAEPVLIKNASSFGGALLNKGRLLVYCSDSKKIKAYTLVDDKLTEDASALGGAALEEARSKPVGSASGNFYLTDFSGTMSVYDADKGLVNDGKRAPEKGLLKKLMAVSPDGKTGLVSEGRTQTPTYLIDLDKYAENLDAPAADQKYRDLALREFAQFSNLNDDQTPRNIRFKEITAALFGGERNYIGGGTPKAASPKNRSGHGVAVYDKDWNEITFFNDAETKLDDPGNMGYVHGIEETKNGGFVVLDANFRQLVFFDKDAKPLGNIKLSKLLGLSYCWPAALIRWNENSCILMAGQEFDNNGTKQCEVMAYLVEGL
jgi:hypothetical protein